MNFRPAGMSDDDDDEDDDYYGGGGGRPRRAYNLQPSNGSPKTIDEAIDRKDLEAVKKFLGISISKGQSIDGCLPSGMPALVKMCGVGFVEGVELLLEKGANPNVQNELITPLSMCCAIGQQSNREECVDLLLKAGADPNTIDSRGRTPLMLAASYGLKPVVSTLLTSPRTSLTMTDPRGWTALFFALEKGFEDIAQLLKDSGLNPDIRDKDGYAAEELFYADKPVTAAYPLAELFVDPSAVDEVALIEKLVDTTDLCLNDFLAELPNSDGDGGFSGVTRDILDGAGCLSLTLPSLDLYSVLSGCDDELKRLGVKLQPLRRNILRSVHRYHLRPWSQMSLWQLPRDRKLGMDDLVNAIATILRHLVIIRSSLSYLQGRLSRSSGAHVDISARQEQLKTLVETHRIHKQLQRRFHILLAHFGKMKGIGEYRPGYISPGSSRSRSYIPSCAVVFASFVVAAFVFLHSK